MSELKAEARAVGETVTAQMSWQGNDGMGALSVTIVGVPKSGGEYEINLHEIDTIRTENERLRGLVGDLFEIRIHAYGCCCVTCEGARKELER